MKWRICGCRCCRAVRETAAASYRKLCSAIAWKKIRRISRRTSISGGMLSRLDARSAVTMPGAAVESEPNRAEARNMLGLALAATGRSADAIDQFEAVLKMQPENASARFNLANVAEGR